MVDRSLECHGHSSLTLSSPLLSTSSSGPLFLLESREQDKAEEHWRWTKVSMAADPLPEMSDTVHLIDGINLQAITSGHSAFSVDRA